MRTPLIALAAFAALTAGAAIHAQNGATGLPGQHDPKRVTAGTYQVDPGHTQVLFAYNHLGFTQNMGILTQPSGSLTLDPKALSQAKVSISFPIANIRTGVAALDEHMMKPDLFDAAKFPTATFTSTSIKVDENDHEAEITGNLTIKGVTREVTLDADFVGAGVNPMTKKETVGFNAEAVIKRSDFGLNAFVPAVGDSIELKITAAFEK